MEQIYLNVGCGGGRLPNFRNTDKDEMDITQKWPYERETIDGITSMHVLCEIPWRELYFAFQEMYRVLKKDGVLRFGVPWVDSSYGMGTILGFGNINLFSKDLLTSVLIKHVGFKTVEFPKYHETFSKHQIITQADNRVDETLYVEAFK